MAHTKSTYKAIQIILKFYVQESFYSIYKKRVCLNLNKYINSFYKFKVLCNKNDAYFEKKSFVSAGEYVKVRYFSEI